MSNKYRDVYCGDVTKDYIGKKIKVAGWINSIRNFGSLFFITLRDETGIVQIITEEEDLVKNITRESTATITGTVRYRTGNVNPNMKTGEIEILLESIEILGKCTSTLPFEVQRSKEASEDARLKYRYLDLRNPLVHDKILLRVKIIDFIRNTMKGLGFTEISTPIISTSSPEGARDFVIPSRNYKGKFYALPQAPQIYKQLLMTSGFSKYFQIAPCFRDEDCRADRTLEFYQLDLEMSFVTEEDVFEVGEKVFYDTFTNFSDKYVSPRPFRRISWHDAMNMYGTDKPDLRNPLVIEDVSDVFKNSNFNGFKGKIVKAIKVDNINESNSWFKRQEDYIKSIGGSGLAYIRVDENNEWNSTILKFLTDKELSSLKSRFKLNKNDVLFILAGDKSILKIAGRFRTKLGNDLDLIDLNRFEFCIVYDFPMYEWNSDESKWEFEHNPFNMPKGGLDAFKQDPSEIVANQYDFVCNGNEMASGAVRNHDVELMKKAFSIAGYDEEVIKKKFSSLYTAFQFGAPPHAGMAPGIDRIVMLLSGEENLREVQVFPPNVSGMDLLMGGPNEITAKQLDELGLIIKEDKNE